MEFGKVGKLVNKLWSQSIELILFRRLGKLVKRLFEHVIPVIEFGKIGNTVNLLFEQLIYSKILFNGGKLDSWLLLQYNCVNPYNGNVGKYARLLLEQSKYDIDWGKLVIVVNKLSEQSKYDIVDGIAGNVVM